MTKLPLLFCIITLFTGCTAISVTDMKTEGELQRLYNQATLKDYTSPWNIKNLYDPRNDSMFIPYQLWTGMNWDGDKNAPCMHSANSLFAVNGTSETTITGPHEWQGMNVWFREKTDGSKQQYFVCNPKGIGRVYDSRYPGRRYSNTRCKFPAGYGWRIGTERDCTATSVKITKMIFDPDYNLTAIKFEWRTNGYHDHTYIYAVGYGMSEAWKQ